MTARETTPDESRDDQARDFQTTKEAEEAKDNQPTEVEKRDESPESKVVPDDDRDRRDDDDRKDAVKDAANEAEALASGKAEGAVGTVVERDLHGNTYDVPYGLVTPESPLVVRTSDSDDPARDWTAQHAGGEREDEDGNALDPVALVPVENTPGQTFRVSELPDYEVMKEAGIDPEQVVSGLPVRADVPDEAPRRGIPA